mmetsp:Transcript_40641/g.94890  ORF Transcript_40641/g.94890 Transcript_40641/m.94890 type:complete len:315 (+) Transcript_40641:146-1090(+)
MCQGKYRASHAMNPIIHANHHGRKSTCHAHTVHTMLDSTLCSLWMLRLLNIATERLPLPLELLSGGSLLLDAILHAIVQATLLAAHHELGELLVLLLLLLCRRRRPSVFLRRSALARINIGSSGDFCLELARELRRVLLFFAFHFVIFAAIVASVVPLVAVVVAVLIALFLVCAQLALVAPVVTDLALLVTLLCELPDGRLHPLLGGVPLSAVHKRGKVRWAYLAGAIGVRGEQLARVDAIEDPLRLDDLASALCLLLLGMHLPIDHLMGDQLRSRKNGRRLSVPTNLASAGEDNELERRHGCLSATEESATLK